MAFCRMFWLILGVAERADTESARCGRALIHACHRGTALARRSGRWRIRSSAPVDHRAEAAQSGLGDLSQQEVVGRSPGIAADLASVLLTAEPNRSLLVAVIDVPYPRDHGAATIDLGREIASHPVSCRAFARCDRETTKLGFAVEHAHHAVEH